jgi:hypothetical protein
MKGFVLMVLTFCLVCPAFAGPETLKQTTSEVTADASSTVKIIEAETGALWDGGNYFVVYTMGSYTGGKPQVTLSIDDAKVRIPTQVSISETRAPGIIPFFRNHERKYVEAYAVMTIGDHTVAVDIGGGAQQNLTFTVKPIVLPGVCYAGAGTDIVSVTLEITLFDQHPVTSNARVFVAGKAVPVSSAWIDRSFMRVSIFLSYEEYARVFNGTDEWQRKWVRVHTDSPYGTVRSLLSFEPVRYMQHCND